MSATTTTFYFAPILELPEVSVGVPGHVRFRTPHRGYNSVNTWRSGLAEIPGDPEG